MKKSEKPFFVQNLTEELKTATSVVLVDYTGLSVKAQQDLKKRLREVGANLFVAKNTLFKISAQKAKLSEEAYSDTVLQGPIAYILSDKDPIAALQIIHKFASENEIPQFKVGIIEGSFQDKDSLTKLAKLPSKNILFGQVVGSISSPLYGIVGVLQANLQKMIYILEEYKSKKV